MRVQITLAALAFAGVAHAQPAPGFIGADVRRAISETANDGERAFTRPGLRSERLTSERSASLAPTLAAMNCDTPATTYWDNASAWIRRNTLPAAGSDTLSNDDSGIGPGRSTLPDTRAPEFRAPVREIARDMRGRVQRVEDTIQTNPQHVYLTPTDTVKDRPKDRATDLRQRAEWMTFLAAFLPKLREAHEATPRDLENAFVLALWTRASRAIFTANSETALTAMNELGYPADGQYGAQTEVAFAMLVRASNDAPFAKEALHRGGAAVAPLPLRILEPLAARAPTTPEPTP
jgi:hypothetical protein